MLLNVECLFMCVKVIKHREWFFVYFSGQEIVKLGIAEFGEPIGNTNCFPNWHRPYWANCVEAELLITGLHTSATIEKCTLRQANCLPNCNSRTATKCAHFVLPNWNRTGARFGQLILWSSCTHQLYFGQPTSDRTVK